jgi:predicted dehydrogenase
LDLARFVTDQEVAEVRGLFDPPFGSVDRNVAALLRLRDATLVCVMSSGDVSNPRNDLVVEGSHGVLVCEGTVGTTLGGSITGLGARVMNQTFHVPDPEIELYILMIEDFASAVRDSRDPLASGRDGLELIRLTNSLRAAASMSSPNALQGSD